MAQKYYTVDEAAKVLKVTPADVNRMRERRELYGVSTGAEWKFKVEDVERVAQERASSAASREDEVLLSELELGESDPAKSGTVIGSGVGKDISSGISRSSSLFSDSDIELAESDVRKAGDVKLPAQSSQMSGLEEIDLTLDEDLKLDGSSVGAATHDGKAEGGSSSHKGVLDDDELVLGDSGSGSDVTIGGDSGISLVDPADSGLSLEEPLDLVAGGEDSLELGEDDMLSIAEDIESPAQVKADDDFLLTPLEEEGGDEDSESGSQVIALDSESVSDEAATMIAGSRSAPMLDEDLSPAAGMGMGGGAPAMGVMPGAAPTLGGVPTIMSSPDPSMMGGGMVLPETPYSVWNVLSLALCVILLSVGGMMTYDLARNMWSWEGTYDVSSSLMDWVLGLLG
jgi:excisionase family DNA binding protein